MFDILTVEDVMTAMVLAAIFTWVVNRYIKFIEKSRRRSLSHRVKELDEILEKCYNLFPREMLQFRGEIYKRGMKVRIVTSQNKIFEGKFLGLNSDNMICLMTGKLIIAHAVKNIEEIELLD